MKRSILAALSAAALTLCACGESTPLATAPPANGGVDSAIKVLSNRADLISGGDALVEIVIPPGFATSDIAVQAGGHDVTQAFAHHADGRFLGLVTGLAVGHNTVTARIGGTTHSIDIVNHPNGGPVFSGPQIQPWTCQDGAINAQCDQPAAYSYLYKSTNLTKSDLQPYDPQNPPTDIAMTTTDQGITIPFIVRQEIGYQDRDQYRILTLFQPDQAWEPWQPQEQWNHKLMITLGSGCGVYYAVHDAPLYDYGALIPANPAYPTSYITALGSGFAVLSTALANNGATCGNTPLAAESLVMGKERVVEAYGELRYTIGAGCSGGSLTAQMVANAYPGIFQGVVVQCSYPDAISVASQFVDNHVLLGYFDDPRKWATGVVWTPTQWGDVEGHAFFTNALVTDYAQYSALSGQWDCGVANQYNADTNPGGNRCTATDFGINVLGPRPPEGWSAPEKAAGRGFAGFPVDNIGVQYGLAALRQGLITPAQFVDVNVKVGGIDVDGNVVPRRLVADEPALANAYRSGSINEANNLDQVAIIDGRGPDPTIVHDSYRAFAMRARLDRAHGTHANEVIWEGPIEIIGDFDVANNGLVAMDRWLGAVEQDTRAVPVSQKILDDKPIDINDSCWDGVGNKLFDGLCGNLVVPVYGTPRTVAGDAITTDTNKCQLKPLDRTDDYGLLGMLTFTDAQWAQLQELFADGVCDFSRPGVSQQETVAWQTYQDGNGRVIYGGIALPPPPANSGTGWAAPAFQPFAALP